LSTPLPTGRHRASLWVPLLAFLLLLAAEAAWQVAQRIGGRPLVRFSLPPTPEPRKFGSTEVDIEFGPKSLASTLQVTLLRVRPDSSAEETDVTDLFIARSNGAVGNLTGLMEGKYVLRARVFGRPPLCKDLLIEEDARVSFTVPPPPPLDLA